MAAGTPGEQHPGFLLSCCRKCFLGEQLQLGSEANGAFPGKRQKELPGFSSLAQSGVVGLCKLTRERWLWDQVSF